MKEKTSITLTKAVLRAVDRAAGSSQSRSAYIEQVLRRHFRRRDRRRAQAEDLQRINAAADRLNSEMADILELQAPWTEDE